jgi:hypothetical protein
MRFPCQGLWGSFGLLGTLSTRCKLPAWSQALLTQPSTRLRPRHRSASASTLSWRGRRRHLWSESTEVTTRRRGLTSPSTPRLARPDYARCLRHVRNRLCRRQFAHQVSRPESRCPHQGGVHGLQPPALLDRDPHEPRREDLEGKTLGAAPADAAFAQWRIFVQANGIDASTVAIENVGIPIREPMLAAGQLDAITGLSFSSYVNLKDRGVAIDDVVSHDGQLRRRCVRKCHHREPEIRDRPS